MCNRCNMFLQLVGFSMDLLYLHPLAIIDSVFMKQGELNVEPTLAGYASRPAAALYCNVEG